MLLQLYKNAYTGLSRNSWFLCLVMFVNRSGTMVIPFMSIYCTRVLHFSITQAGYILGIYGLGAISGAFIGGKVTDKIGFYGLQVFALLTGGLFFILLGFLTTFWAMAIGTFVLSICNESFRPANSAAIAHFSTPENRTRSYSLNRLAINIGWAFGVAVGGFLASYNYHLLFWVDGCTNIAAGLLVIAFIPHAKVASAIETNEDTPATTSPYQDKIYLIFIFLVVIFAICFFQLITMQPLFYKTEWFFNERLIGFLFALNGILIGLTEMVLIHRLEGRRHALNYISMGVLLTGAGFVVFNVFPGTPATAILVVLLITLGEMLALPFMNSFWIARTNPGNRGAYAALYTMAWSAAQVLAPTIGSQLIQYTGFAMLWWVHAFLCLAASFGFILLYRANYATNLHQIKFNKRYSR